MIPQDEKTPDEIDLLLPWHAVERLTSEEAERVEAAIARDPERARHLEIAREERAETVALNQGLGLPSSVAREKLFARIEADGRKPRTTGLAARARNFFASVSPGALAWSAAAAALVIAVQAGFLANAYLGETKSGYETASLTNVTPKEGQFALIAFASGASASQIESLLTEERAIIVDGPRAGGLYRLRVADKAADAKTVDAIVGRLKTRADVVRFVTLEKPNATRR